VAEQNSFNIYIDLEKFDFSVDLFDKRNIDYFQLNFKGTAARTAREFHFAVIAFVANQMKESGALTPIPVKENVTILWFLDKQLSGIHKSPTKTKLFNKITKAWTTRLTNLERAEFFKIIDRDKKFDSTQNRYIYDVSKGENDFWKGLINISGSGETASLKLSVDRNDLELDDIGINFKGCDDGAWNRFLASLKSEVAVERLTSESEYSQQPLKLTADRRLSKGSTNQKAQVVAFLEKIESRYGYISTPSLSNEIRFEDQYIPVYGKLGGLQRHEIEDQSRSQVLESNKGPNRHSHQKNIQVDKLPNQDLWDNLKKRFARILVVSGPGTGKSTLLDREALLKAQEARELILKQKSSIDKIVFPLRLQCSDLEQSGKDIKDAILDIIGRECLEDFDIIKPILKEKLDKGQCVLLIDAFDTIPESRQSQFNKRLNTFAKSFSGKIICTSRNRYSGPFLDRTILLKIVPFGMLQINEYVRKWFKNNSLPAGKVPETSRGLLNQIKRKPKIKSLCRNPLLLSFLCSLYTPHSMTAKPALLPLRRAEVYKQLIAFTLAKWPASKKSSRKLLHKAQESFLEYIAYSLSCQATHVLSLDQLKAYIDEYLQDPTVQNTLKSIATETFVNDLIETNSILVNSPSDETIYTFFHPTIQEYLTASYLNQIFRKNKGHAIRIIRRHLWKSDWHEAIKFLAGIMDDPIPLLQVIIDENDDFFSSMLVLSAMCLSESQESSHPLTDQIAFKLFELWMLYPESEAINAAIIDLGQSHLKVTRNLIRVIDSDPLLFLRSQAIKVLGQIATPQAIKALIDFLYADDGRSKTEAVEALGEIAEPQAIQTLASLLRCGEPDTQYAARNALKRIGGIEAFTAIHPLFSQCGINLSENPDSVFVLKNYNDPHIISLLASAALDLPESEAATVAITLLKQCNKTLVYEALIQYLDDSNFNYPDYREAAEILGSIGGPEIIAALTDEIGDAASSARFWAAYALACAGSSQGVRLLRKEIYSEGEAHTIEAAHALGMIDTSEALNVLAAAMDPNNPAMCRIAVKALEFGNSPQSMRMLLKAIDDPQARVRELALNRLHDFIHVDVVTKLSELTNSQNVKIRTNSTKILAAFACPKIQLYHVNEELFFQIPSQVFCEKPKIISEPSSDSNIEYDSCRQQAEKLLIHLIDADWPEVRFYSALALGLLGYPDAIDVLIRIVKDKDAAFLQEAIFALGRIGSPKAIEQLAIATKNSNIYVATNAIRAIGQIGGKRALDVLNEATKAKAMYKVATETLTCMSGEGVARALFDVLLKTDDSELLRIATLRLCAIGTSETLDNIVTDPDCFLFHPYIFSLAKILSDRFMHETKYAPLFHIIIEKCKPTYWQHKASFEFRMPQPSMFSNNIVQLSPTKTVLDVGLFDFENILHEMIEIVRIENEDIFQDNKEMTEFIRIIEDNPNITTHEYLKKIALKEIEDEISSLLKRSLFEIKIDSEKAIITKTGDGAILLFNSAVDAHKFAIALHLISKQNNESRSRNLKNRWFQIGASSGWLYRERREGKSCDISGHNIAKAIYLRNAAKPGEVLVDLETYNKFYSTYQVLYKEERMPFKLNTPLWYRRFSVYSEVDGERRAPECTIVNEAAGKAYSIHQLLDLIPERNISRLIYLMEMPIAEVPPNSLSPSERMNYIFKWAEQSEDLMKTLEFWLNYLVK
jgi:HEAT repeat protein